MSVNNQATISTDLLRMGGAFTTVFSVVLILLVIFAFPWACSIVGALQILILTITALGGLAALITGQFLVRRRNRRA